MADIIRQGITYPDAPAVFDLVWADQGVIPTRRGPRRLHRADATPAFVAAWPHVSRALRDIGFAADQDYDHDRRQYVPVRVQHWGDGTVLPVGALTEIEQAVAEYADRARIAQEERDRVIAEGTALFLARLRETQAAIGWAWSAAAALQVRDLLAKDSLVEWQWQAGDALIKRAQDAVAKARTKIAAEVADVAEQDLVAVEDPAVREAVLAAVRAITLQDDDLATEANGVGWSPATSKPGHVLAREEVLDPGRAVVGMRLLRKHPRQVPNHLRSILGIAA